MTRHFWLILGVLAVALASLGVVLPLLPTTPFLLVAAFCFARSSPRLHGWLLNHRVFGPFIHNWHKHGAISPTAKRAAVLTIVLAFAISVALGVAPLYLAIQAAVLACSATFILTRPDGPAEPR